MKETLQPGVQFRFRYEVPVTRTVPYLLPESEEFQAMPEVLAWGTWWASSSGPASRP